MWFATDNGLSRFDGYAFKNYGPREGLKDPVVFFMQMDSRQRIWMATLSGNLYFLESDSIKAYSGNELIRGIKGEFPVTNYLMGKNDEHSLRFTGLGWLIIDRDGNHKLVQGQNRLGAHFLYNSPAGWVYGNTNCPDSLKHLGKANYFDKGVLPALEIHDSTGVGTVKGILHIGGIWGCF